MSLSNEWKKRIDLWRNELPNHFFKKLGSIEMSGFTTFEHLSAAEALEHVFYPMPAGTKWGAKWEYGWFKGEVVLPQEAKGKRIVAKVYVGKESAIYINGKNAGAKDFSHLEITLSQSGIAGERYEILAECYGGHGPRMCDVGPVYEGKVPVPEPGPTQVEVWESTYGIWEEDVYQLWLDVETLFQTAAVLDVDSLRAVQISKGLKDFTLIVDFEAGYDVFIKTVKEARKRLKPLLECVNGSTVPVMYTFGHSHIDLAWMWPIEETKRKCARTLSTQIALMNEYPEYIFLQSQPELFVMVKKYYPELYERLKEKVKSGQIMPEGGMWVEADTNITGGESLIRQFIHGKRFYREEFGIESELMWLPDVFGYSGALPQIMKGCGIKYFSTAKIFWNYNGGDSFPYNTFIWEGIDGTGILSHLFSDYGAYTDPKTITEKWNGRVQKDISTRMYPFGLGDGGGGASRDHLEFLRRAGDLEGVPRTRMAGPVQFFKDLEKEGLPDERYVGELYYQCHRGTYTSQARIKRKNRKSEFALREAEMWGAVARTLKGKEYPLNDMDAVWKKVLINQFHDILPGSSIKRVYEEANAEYDEVICYAGNLLRDSAASLIHDKEGLVVFNSLSWDRNTMVELPDSYEGVKDIHGQNLPVQVIGDKNYTEVRVPSCGWITLQPGDIIETENTLVVSEQLIENEYLRIQLNNAGEITSIYDKETGMELAAGVCNSFKMYKDLPTANDAWDIDSMYIDNPVQLSSASVIEVLDKGPLAARIRVSRKINQSQLSQVITMYRASRRVEFSTTIDWQECHKLLKVEFPVDIHTNEAIHEIQFGHLRRPNHKSRQFDADRFEVCNHKWSAVAEENRGFAVLNDCKYGINVAGNSMNLTLLKAAQAPDMYADRGIHEFTYAFYAWNGTFAESDVIREAYELNCPVNAIQGYAGENSMFAVDALNIIIEMVKPAEDGSNDIIIRMYEARRMTTHCRLTVMLPFSDVFQTDMLEAKRENLEFKGNNISLKFRPFEIKTIRLVV